MKRIKVINDVVMVTREFGCELFIAPLNKLDIAITDKKEDAEKWSSIYDQLKLKYYQSVTGYKKLQFEKL